MPPERTDVAPRVVAFVLAKNEEPNIARCLAPLSQRGIRTTVLDSGSTDRTREIAGAFPHVTVEPFRYVNHLASYEQITASLLPEGTFGLVLDADMVVTDALFLEIEEAARDANADVGIAPVTMYWLGKPLGSGSLYPPKPVFFRGGRSYFEAAGHGEQLRTGLKTRAFVAPILHDDRKGFGSYLASQVRYARASIARAENGETTWRDRIRMRIPAMVFVTPIVSFVLRGGFRAGRVGVVYALDRVIAELIVYRAALVARIPGADDGP